MRTPRTRAWQFRLPRIDEPDEYAGLQVTAAGAIGMVDGDASIRQSLLLLLATVPGERVMRPGYGCDIQRLVFAGNDETTAGLAMHYVRRAVERWEPRIEILGLDAGAPDGGPAAPHAAGADSGTLEIVLDYRIRASGQRRQLSYRLNLAESD
jgi:phage baseplate assembly protein W